MKLVVLILVFTVIGIQARSVFNDRRIYLDGDKKYHRLINLLMKELRHLPKESLKELLVMLDEKKEGSGAEKFSEDMKEMHKFLPDYVESGDKADIAALLAEIENLAERSPQSDQVSIRMHKVYDGLPPQVNYRYSARRFDEQ